MKRGRKPMFVPPPIDDLYRCSECDFKSKKFIECDRHVQLKHYGQALINDKRPLTDPERLSGYIRSIKLCKVFKCSKCPKSFRSGLGYKFHLELCGKNEEETFQECEICSQRLRIHSMTAHMKAIHCAIFDDLTISKKVEKGKIPISALKRQQKQQTSNDILLLNSKTNTPSSSSLLDNTSIRSNKRSSAIKALNLFKKLINDDDEDDTEESNDDNEEVNNLRSKSTTKKYNKVKEDEEYQDDTDEDEEEEDEFKDYVSDESNDQKSITFSSSSPKLSFSETEEDNSDNEGIEDIKDKDNDSKSQQIFYNVTRADLDEIFFLCKQFIVRKPKMTNGNANLGNFETKLLDLEQDTISKENNNNDDENEDTQLVTYKCYNERCKEKFPFRIEMENHYKKCCSNTEFTFACGVCSSSTSSTTENFESNFINLPMGQHLFLNHSKLLDSSNVIYKKWIDYFGYKGTTTAKYTTLKYTPLKRGRRPKSSFEDDQSSMLFDNTNSNVCTRPYCVDLLEYYRDNSVRKTFQCIRDFRSNWNISKRNTHNSSQPITTTLPPRFKSTLSMDSGDNEFKFIPKFGSMETSNKLSGFTFNVGQPVTAAAWLPLPFQNLDNNNNKKEDCDDQSLSTTDGTEDDDGEPIVNNKKSEQIRLNQFPKIQMTQCDAEFDQYLMIATNSGLDPINGKHLGQNYLQLWNMGPLVVVVVGGETKQGASSTSQVRLPRLSLNIEHRYGPIDELCWCPYGTTYDDIRNLEQNMDKKVHCPLKRLGLLALACQDGTIKIHSIPHPYQFAQPQSTQQQQQSVIYELSQPNLTLTHCIKSIKNCRTLAWNPEWPQDMMLGGYNDGYICLWNMSDYARCDPDKDKPGKHHKSSSSSSTNQKLNPQKIYRIGKNVPILSIIWLNPSMFVTSSIESCKVWHLWYPEPYAELRSIGFFHKLARHPMWYHAMVMCEFMINRSSTMIYMRSYIEDEFDIRNSHVLANYTKIRINDISISPWMYLMAYCTDNGELVTTEVLPRPHKCEKKSKNFQLYTIHLGNLIEFDREDTDTDDDTDVEPVDGAENDSTKMNGIIGRKKVMTTNKKKNTTNGRNGFNQVLNKTVDLNFTYKDFFMKYFFIFNDCDKKIERNPTKSIQCSTPLTKNDLVRFYSISHCSWNPNLSSYSWLFSATRSGLCRINSYSFVNPQKI